MSWNFLKIQEALTDKTSSWMWKERAVRQLRWGGEAAGREAQRQSLLQVTERRNRNARVVKGQVLGM